MGSCGGRYTLYSHRSWTCPRSCSSSVALPIHSTRFCQWCSRSHWCAQCDPPCLWELSSHQQQPPRDDLPSRRDHLQQQPHLQQCGQQGRERSRTAGAAQTCSSSSSSMTAAGRVRQVLAALTGGTGERAKNQVQAAIERISWQCSMLDICCSGCKPIYTGSVICIQLAASWLAG